MPFGFDPNAVMAAPAPAPNPGVATPPADWLANYIKAAAQAARANPARGISNILYGHDVDAATAAARTEAPAAYNKVQDAQTNTQNGQLGLAQQFQILRAMGLNVDPNNIPESYTAAAPLVPGETPQGTGGAQGAQPSGNPLDAQRAMFRRLGIIMSRFPAYAAAGQKFLDFANQGLPDNTAVLPNGQVADVVNGQPVSMSAQDYNAQGKFKNAQATEIPHVQGEEAIDNHHTGNQAYLDTHRAEVNAANTVEGGISTKTGLPTFATDYDIAHGRAPDFAKSNPYQDNQQKEIGKLTDAADSATQGLDIATQLANTANGLYTGKGANALQNFRKTALAAAQFAGVDTDPRFTNATSQFEQLKFLSQQLVAKASHDVNPRVSQQIYSQIAAVKPGESSSIKGLRDIISNQIIPMLARQRALLPATVDYYRQNPFRNDAAATVPDKLPLQNFSVKTDLHKVKPGDYFIDPATGNIRQRPVQ